MYDITHHAVVSHEEWRAARKQLLAEEKEFTRLRDRLSQRRRDLPWEAVEKEYVFEGPHGRQTLAELFDGRSQLVVYHAMFDPATASPQTSWTVDAACPGCSFWADNFNGITVHLHHRLHHRDVTQIAVSHAPYAAIAAYRQRMGWTFPWVSSGTSDFNVDYGVSFTAQEVAEGQADLNDTRQDPGMTEREGLSVFVKDAGHAPGRADRRDGDVRAQPNGHGGRDVHGPERLPGDVDGHDGRDDGPLGYPRRQRV